MELTSFLILQFLAHLLADYFFQTNASARDKNTHGFKSKFLVSHVLFVFLFSWLLSFQVKFFIGAAVIAVFHYFIDGCKAYFNRNKSYARYTFFVDQLFHIIVFIAVSFVFDKYHGFQFYWEPPITTTTLAIIVAYVCCLKPANILIKEVFRSSEIDVAIAKKEVGQNTSKTEELPNAGKLIGILERVLALTFILIGQYQAVGFLIAAKSVLRYKDTDTLKTEYVLIGTMLSFGIAVVLGILATSI